MTGNEEAFREGKASFTEPCGSALRDGRKTSGLIGLAEKIRTYFFFLGAVFFFAGAFFFVFAGAFLIGMATSFELLEKLGLNCTPYSQGVHHLTTTHRGAVLK